MKLIITLLLLLCCVVASSAQDSLSIDIVGYVPSWDAGHSIATSGSLAYISTDLTGIRILDISDKTNPHEIGFYNIGGSYEKMKIYNDVMYCDRMGGLAIIDISDPMHPYELNHTSLGVVNDFVFHDNYIYTAQGSAGWSIIDISDPYNPETIYYLNTDFSVYSVRYSSDFLYISTEDGLMIYDISTPSYPNYISTIVFRDTFSCFEIRDEVIYFVSGAGLTAYDISVIINPILIGSTDVRLSTKYFELIGNKIFGVGTNNLSIYLIDDYGKPRLLNSYDGISNGIHMELEFDISTSEICAYVLTGRPDVHIFQIYPNNEITELGYVSEKCSPRNVVVRDNLAYLASADYGLRIYDVSTPSIPTLVSSYTDVDAVRNIYLVDNYAYLSAFGDGLVILDISDPLNPSFVGSIDPGWYLSQSAYDVVVVGNTAYMADAEGLFIIDVSDPTNPLEIGSLETDWSCMAVDVVQSYAYLANDHDGMLVVDISTDPANPELVADIGTIGYAKDLDVEGNYAYVAAYVEGLTVVDITNPYDPHRVGWFNNPASEWALGVTVVDNIAYMVSCGVYALDVSNPSQPTQVGHIETTWAADDVCVAGNYAYTAEPFYMNIMEISPFASVSQHTDGRVSQSYTLRSAYPNPFNASTTLRFSLRQESTVNVLVYNTTGATIRTLASGWYTAGDHHLYFDASNLTSGMYFVELTIPGYTREVQRITLVK